MEVEIRAHCFHGFYETIWSENTVCSNEAEALCMNYPEHEWEHLDDWDCAPEYRQKIAEIYADYYISALNDTLKLNMKVTRVSVWSPREYNFETDEIDITVEVGDFDEFVEVVFNLLNQPITKDRIREVVKKRHSSCSGFISRMSNDINDWRQMIEAGYYLYLSCLLWYLYEEYCGCSYPGEDIESSAFEYASGNGYMEAYPQTPEAKEEYNKVIEKYGN